MARWSSYKTYSQMPAEDKSILIDCINSAVFNWFAAAPERLRMTTVSHLVNAPESGTVTVTEGSNELTGLFFDQYHLGAAIQLDGDDIMNEIVSVEGTPQVLNQIRTSGTVGYTIYFDTIMITDFNISRIVSNPRVLDTGQELYRDDEGMKFMGAERKGNLWGPYSWWTSATTRSFGRPYRYVFDNTGVSLGDEARMMMRLDPIPKDEMTIVFDAVIDAPTYTLKDLEGTVRLPVPDPYVIPQLLPIALSDLASTPLWGDTDPAAAMAKGQLALSKVSDTVPKNNGAPRNRHRTRRGY